MIRGLTERPIMSDTRNRMIFVRYVHATSMITKNSREIPAVLLPSLSMVQELSGVGILTLSMPWITPLLVAISPFVT
jgi:hypothetical protein